MNPSKGDAVGVIEPSYDLGSTDERWLAEITERLDRLLRPELSLPEREG